MSASAGKGVEDRRAERCCVVIPAYREEVRIAEVVAKVRQYCNDVIVVDDGSPDRTAEEAKKAGADVIVHESNMGKGVALTTGFERARERGFSYLVTMDGDGQHDPADIPAFVEAYVNTGTPVLVGNRMDEARTMPFVRRLTNRFMSWLLSGKMGQHVPDTQSGFRLYRCDVIPEGACNSERFAAESEILLCLAERRIVIGSVPIRVIYRDEKSKINPFKDTIRFFRMLRKYEARSICEDRLGE